MPLQLPEILGCLRTSDRWGINSQPLDVHAYAEVLARLPCRSIEMRRPDNLIVSFERALTQAEAFELVQASDLDPEAEDPFPPTGPKLEAFLWWD